MLDPFDLNVEAGRAIARDDYLSAELKYRMAATVALTPEGKRVLLDKADRARAQRLDRQARA